MGRTRSRREFLAAFGIGAAAFATGCGTGSRPRESASLAEELETEANAIEPSPTATATATETPTPIPTPTPRPAGDETVLLMHGTDWETPALIRSTGVPGPALVVLGGVHGNEPAGWLAAEAITKWEPRAGALAVLPHANTRAIAGFARLVDGEGDLNRQYPGDSESSIATSRLAAEITALCATLDAEVVLDLHESWAFFVDRETDGFVNRAQTGTAYLGQTLTGGAGPRGHQIAGQIAAIVNEDIANERELFIPRDGWAYRRNDAGGQVQPRGRSSLALGGYVPGLTPVLVETGQRNQPLERRVVHQQAVVRATMDILGM